MSSYADYSQFKAETDLLDAAATDQATIERLLAAATRNIDRFCNRPDGFVAEAVASARIYAGSGKSYQLIDECISIALVAVKDSATDSEYASWSATDWIAFSGDAKAPDFNSLPYNAIMVDPIGDESLFTSGAYLTRSGFRPRTDTSRGVPTVQTTARWGYAATVPDDILEACIMQSARWYKRLQSSMADALASPELGTLQFRKSLDPDIQHILVAGRYVKPAVGRW